MHNPPITLAALLEPAVPDLTAPILAEAAEVDAAIRRLDGRISTGLAHVVGPLFRAAHTHHSLYIEDRPSTLADLARAAASTTSRPERDRVADLKASLDALGWLHEGEGRSVALGTPTGRSLLRDLHRRFYEHLPPEARRVRTGDTGREMDVNPGEWREEHVAVGGHHAPSPADVDGLVFRWEARYAPLGFSPGPERLLAAIASHHRLLFIHPFRDGNGRVARLTLDAYLIALGLDAKGAWTPARGFARARSAYYSALGAADAERRHPTDGRGTRSADGLRTWCTFVLGTFREQVEFVSALLEPTVLRSRVRLAVAADVASTANASDHAARLVSAAWDFGPLTRAAIVRESGVPERSARRLLAALERLGWVRTTAGRDRRESLVLGAVPLRAAPTVFPNLFLPDATLAAPTRVRDE